MAGALAWPACAWAQTPTIPEEGLPLKPPVVLAPDTSVSRTPIAARTAAAPAPDDELPNTGSDPRLLFLAGLALVLVGSGLRLRTADADLY
jgi:LPXTG-motif cell wall-anchored protein